MLEKLKEMQDELKGLAAARAEDATKNAESIADLEKQIEEAQNVRKSASVEVLPTDVDVTKAINAGKAAYLKAAIMGKSMNDFEGFKEASDVIEKALKPADVADWLAEAFAKDVIEKLELELKVATMFDKITIPDGYSTLSIPARTSNLTAYLIAPAADAVESVIADGKITFSTQKIKTMTVLADESNEEVVTSVLDLSKKELIRSLARAVETVVIMGDTAFATANDPKKVADGILKAGRANAVDAGGDALATTDISAARVKMGILGMNTEDLALIVTPAVYMNMVGTMTDILTMDKVGTKATLLTGAIGSLYGISIICSEYIPENLETSGAEDTGTGATTAAILVNKTAFLRADRANGIVSESDRNIVNDTNILTSKVQFDFKSVLANGEIGVVSIVNVLP